MSCIINEYKVNKLPSKGKPNSRYYVPNPDNDTLVDEYVTDKDGNYKQVSSGVALINVSAGATSAALDTIVFSNLNNVSFGLSGSTITASVIPGGSGTNFILGNANGMAFGTLGSTVTASYTVPTNYISSNQSSLFQLTANNSLSLGTDYTSHTHSQYINTSQSSLFLTSQSGHGFSAEGGVSAFQTLVFQNQTNGLTFSNVGGLLELNHALQFSSNTSQITSNAINTSNSSLFQHTTLTSLITSNALHTSSPRLQAVEAGTSSFTYATISFENSNGVSWDINGPNRVYLHHELQYSSNTSNIISAALNTSQSTVFLTNQTQQPFAVSGTNASSTFNTLQLGTENGLTLYLTNGSLVGSYTDGGGGGGDGLNRISAGTQIAGVTQTIVLSNSNNVSFGMSNNSVVTASASYSQPTDYVSTAQSSLFQQTSLMSNYLGTDYSSHTHSQYVNTSQSSLFEQSSHTTVFLTTQSGQAFSASGGSSTFQTLEFVNSNGFTFSNTNGSIRASYSVPTDYVSSNQSSLFALTANDSLSLGTTYTSHTHSQYLNTSQSSLFEQSSHTTVFLTTQSGQAYSAGNGSATFQTLSIADSNGVSFSSGTQGLYATVRTNYASSDHSHGNPTLALTNLSGTTASNSAGFTLSLSAAAGGGGADGYNILAAGTQTANTTGTVVLSNSNGMSFGMNNSSIITASYTVPTDYVSTAQSSLFLYTSQSSLFEHTSHTTIFLTTQSGQAFSAGAASSVFQTLSFQDSNGVSFSNNAGAIRVSHALQFTSNTSAITASALNTSQSSLFQHTSATSAITANALNTSQSSLFQHTSATSAITANALNTSVSRVINIVAATNNTGGGTASLSSNVSFSNANAVSFYTSAGGAIVASVNTSYAASNHSHGNPTLALTNLTGTTASASNGFTLSLSAAAPGAGGGIVLANSQTTYTSGTVNLSGAGAITIQSTTGQSFQISVPATSSLSATGIVSISTNGSTVSIGASQSNQNISLYALGNTTQNSSTVLNASVLSLNGLQGITVGFSNGSIQLSGATGGTGGGGGIVLANSQTTYTSGTAYLSGAGAITIQSTTGQSYIVSAPGSSSLSATGHASISVNGSTISIGAPSPAISGSNGSFTYSTLTLGNLNNVSFYTSNGSVVASINAAGGPTLSNFQHPENMWTSLGANGQGSLSIKRMYIPFSVTGTRVNIGMSVSAATNTSATTASANISLWMGIYTLNGSSLSLASSGSANNGFQWSQSASSTGNTSINSMRLMSVPMNVNITPGEYWLGVVISSATTYTSAGFTFYGGNLINNAATAAVFAPIGSGTTASSMQIPFQGIYTAATSAGPSSMSKAHINFSSASNVMRANLYCQILNNTY